MGDRDHPSPSKSCRSRIKEMQATVAAVEERRQQMQLGMERSQTKVALCTDARKHVVRAAMCC